MRPRTLDGEGGTRGPSHPGHAPGIIMRKMSIAKASRLSRTAIAAAMALVLVALAPGLAPYEAAAQFTAGSVAGSAAHGPAPVVLPGAGASGIVPTIPAAGTLVPTLGTSLSFSAAASALVGAPSAVNAALPSAAVFSPAAAIPALPVSAVAAAASLPVGTRLLGSPASAERAVVPSPEVASFVSAATLASEPSSNGVRSRLSETVRAISESREQSAQSGLLDKLFTGVRSYFGLDETAPSSAASVVSAPALAAVTAQAASSSEQSQPASGEKAATAPTSVHLEGRGLARGEKFLSGEAKSAEVPAVVPTQPGGDDWIDRKAITGMFIQRSISIAAFILTSLAYPLVAIHAVGAASFGVLMALGPLAAIATGPLNGFIADKMSPRNGLILLAVLRGVLAFALPAFTYFGILGFVPLLLASIANGWQLSLLMTSESAYFRRLAGKNQIETINSLGAVNYFSLQVFLTLILGVGSFIDKWNPMMPFVLSTILHLTVVPLIIWFMLPNIAPQAKAKVVSAVRSAREALADRAAKASAFFKKFWKEIGLFGLGVGAYLVWSSPLPMSGALLYWVTRTDGFKAVWSQKALRATMLLSALAFGLIYPFQYMAVPLMAGIIGGAAGKGLVLGQLLGALFFGQLTANASQAKLPPVRIPFTTKTIPAQRIVQGVVLALGAAWSFLRLFPGSWPAAAAALAIGSVLMYGSSKLTSRGWIKFLGAGLAAASLLPLFFWGSMPALFAGMLALGLFVGPASVALTSYFSRNAKEASIGNAFGVNSSMMNSATSFGYGLMTLLISFFKPSFPGALGPIAIAFLLIGAVFFIAPRFLPGLPDKSVSNAKPADDKK